MSSRLGELLVRESVITTAQLKKAQDEQRKGGGRLGSSLVKLGMIEESELTSFLSKQYGVPAINLQEFDISHIPPGIYFLHLRSDGASGSCKLIVR